MACASSFFTPAPFPFVCVVSSMPMCHHPHPMCCGVCEACHMHCVWWLALSNTLPCCAPSSLLFSFCPSLFHHHHPQTNTQGCGEKRGRKEEGEEEEEKGEEERCDAKNEWKKRGGKKRKRDYDTWCSQVVSNPSTNQARRGLTSLIRREVVLSSWYGRNSLFLFLLSLFVSVWMIVEKC